MILISSSSVTIFIIILKNKIILIFFLFLHTFAITIQPLTPALQPHHHHHLNPLTQKLKSNPPIQHPTPPPSEDETKQN
ncbi:hypothetical protein GYH30_017597 [Glycine max]|nr:hypothetical protein GYH30_017597 [Glycine max]